MIAFQLNYSLFVIQVHPKENTNQQSTRRKPRDDKMKLLLLILELCWCITLRGFKITAHYEYYTVKGSEA